MSHWWELGLVDEYNSSIPYTGNIDLDKRKVLREDGVYKTENSITIGVDGKQVIIPTVVDGVQLEEEAAIDHFYETGEQLGAYDTIAEAEKAAQNIHLRQQTKYGSDFPVTGKGSPFVKGVERAEAEIALAKKASQDPYISDLVPDIGDLNITDVNTTSIDTNTSSSGFNLDTFLPKLYDVETKGGKWSDRVGSQYSGIAQLGKNERFPILKDLNITDAQYKNSIPLQKKVAKIWITNKANQLKKSGFEVNEFNVWAAHNQGNGGMNQIIHGKVSPGVLKNIRNQTGMDENSTHTDYINYYKSIFNN